MPIQEEVRKQVEVVTAFLANDAELLARQGHLLLSGRLLTARQVIRALWTTLEQVSDEHEASAVSLKSVPAEREHPSANSGESTDGNLGGVKGGTDAPGVEQSMIATLDS